jgi:hypothetical protein
MVRESERVTSVAIYTSDRDWLQERQRKVSFDRGRHIPMCDLMREFVQAIQAGEAEGA